jgi:hypothetical protein
MFWKIGIAIGDFAKGFVFSAQVWAGIALTGLAVVLFVVSGSVRRRSVKRGPAKQAAGPSAGATGTLPAATGGALATRPAPTAPATAPAKAPAKGRKGKNDDLDDDDLGDVADILRRHGIT